MATNTTISLPNHYERHFGTLDEGWSDDGCHHGIQIVCFKNQPETGVTTFASLGLSRYILQMSKARQIRQEILVSADEMFARVEIANFLLSLAEFIINRGKPFLRGEVISLEKPIIPHSTLSAVYVTNPSPWNDTFIKFNSEPIATVFAYLIPITEAEASLVAKRGWSWFEDELEKQNPNIWDLTRSEQVLD